MKTKVINSPDLKKAASRKREPTRFDMIHLDKMNELMPLVKGQHYFIKTYGCQANVRDEETMRGMLENIGLVKTENREEADVILLNTCAVRENAEDKLYGEIGNLKGYIEDVE